jgi:hypothetical protein
MTKPAMIHLKLRASVFAYNVTLVDCFADEFSNEASMCRMRFGLVAQCWPLLNRRLWEVNRDDPNSSEVMMQATLPGLSAN